MTEPLSLVVAHANDEWMSRAVVMSTERAEAWASQEGSDAKKFVFPLSQVLASGDMLAALKAQHEAIDRLFALLLTVTRKPEEAEEFFPSKSGQPWAAALMGRDAIRRAEGETPDA